MSQPNQTTIRCASCGQPFPAQVRMLLDAQADPQGKALLVNGRLNQFPCPQCGFVNQVLTPVLYHDPAKELLIACVPMEVSMRGGGSEEKIVGDMLNDLTRATPKEQFRAYMLNPKRALTLQGLIEQVMAADGITPEMLKAQRDRVELIQKLLEAGDEVVLKQLIEANDSAIDLSFFQTMTLMGQRLAMEGREDIARLLAEIQQGVLMFSSFGQEVAEQQQQQEAVVREVAQAINTLGEGATRDDLINLAIGYADDDTRLQALVGLVRAAFDSELFTLFTQRISQAPTSERDALQAVRDRVEELTGLLQQQDQQALQRAAQFLQVLVNSADPQEMIVANIELIDNDFMAVLTANIQEAQRRQDARALSALENIYRQIVGILQSQMPADLRFINELLGAPDETTMQAMINERINEFDAGLLLVCDEVEKILTQQGQAGAIERLAYIRAIISQHVS